ncbi:hypothetical protein JK635_05430 [Neobacillus sp. YIM B02564]|uniref:RNA polymerase sigma factor 70 region 4 type 2 domain-containing protein n=1 Tax=Neobacillus paridis TaxID=2803862 RepID=A0ABS1TK40_9BACI|nr:sigma factor-like helix-turn-helix DNA-binding protein [Neobacillus paridis]MBL4951680.1 hypothetical protein [Neobacillus paridis]
MTWFTKIIICCSGQILQRRSNVVPLKEELISELPAAERNHKESIDILQVLSRLQENYRTALILFYYHDNSIKIISDILDIPESTVKTNLSRGKLALKKFMKARNKAEHEKELKAVFEKKKSRRKRFFKQ